MITKSLAPSLSAAVLIAAAASLHAQAPSAPAAPAPLIEVAVTNPSAFARTEMVEVPYKQIPGLAKIADLAKVHVISAAGKEVLAQGVDTNGDYDDDVLVFQAELGPNASARFKLTLGDARKYKKEDFRVNGRFVRERFDDFVWENDKVAFRMYGEALETWEREPLTSSTVDAWVKKTPKLTVNDWYLVDDYHKDHGEGGDFYSAGRTRGCGGSGLLRDGKLYTSKNFRASRVLSRGPIRLVFELTYLPFDVGGVNVSEVKRVTLDAGSNFNKFESFYRTDSGAPLPEGLLWATGVKKEKTADLRPEAAKGVVRSWQELTAYARDGWMGCALVVDPARAVASPELDGNLLLTFRGPGPYYAGTGWDRSGDFKTMADFDAHVETFTKRIAAPFKVDIGAAR
jgi:hypothetical protein